MMRSVFLRVGLLFAALILVILPSAAQRTTRGDGPIMSQLGLPDSSADPAELRQAAAERGSIRVIVTLQTEHAGRMAFDAMNEQAQQAVIAQTQDVLLAELGLTRSAANVTRYVSFPALAMQVNSEQLELLLESTLASHVREDSWREPSLIEATTNLGMTGTNGAWASGADGQGQVVAILDSGIAKAHDFLAGKVISEACFSSNIPDNPADDNYFTVSSLCPSGLETSFEAGSGEPCTVSGGQCEHGTHIAGIIAGKGSTFSGVAKEAKLISIKVFSKLTDATIIPPGEIPTCNRVGHPYNECILASDRDILAGLDYVRTNRNNPAVVGTNKLAAVNLSVGSDASRNTGVFTQAECDTMLPDYKVAVGLLHDAGIPVIASAGNRGFVNAVDAPACVTGVISVGASCDGVYDLPFDNNFDGQPDCVVNTIAPFSNSASYLTFMAPGWNIDSAAISPPNGFTQKWGTSQAAAFVTGAYAALRSYKPGMSVGQVTTALHQSAVSIGDYPTPLFDMFPKIQVNAALPLLIFPDQPTLLSPAPNAAFAETPMTFVWTAGEETTSYRLQVYNNAKTSVLAAVTVDHAACAPDPAYPGEDAVCSASITHNFKDDRFYQWRVVAKNSTNGSSAKSEWRAFQFDTPGAALLLSPEHKITIYQPQELFQFQWTEVPLATHYRVTLFDTANGSVKLDTPQLDEAVVCAASVCTYTTTPADVSGLRDDRRYKWYVTSINATGTSLSAKRVIKAQFPAAPLLTSPADKHVFRSRSEIALSWTDVAGAEQYKIKIVDTTNGKLAVKETLALGSPNLSCLSGTCTFVPTPEQLTKFKNKHTFRWKVTALNALGSNTSAPLTFKTKFPAPPVLISPTSPSTLASPAISFVFSQIADADSYELLIKIKANGKVVVKRGLTPGGNLACNGTDCTYALNADDQSGLKSGKTYLWFVRSVSADGKSASAKYEFTLQ